MKLLACYCIVSVRLKLCVVLGWVQGKTYAGIF